MTMTTKPFIMPEPDSIGGEMPADIMEWRKMSLEEMENLKPEQNIRAIEWYAM